MLYGAGKYTYELVDGWAKCPEGYSFVNVGGLAIDPQDRVYISNRGGYPVIVFDREGNLLTHWGEGYFKREHGICVAPDGSVYCGDDADHAIYKFSSEGKLLQTFGTKGQPSDTGYVAKSDMIQPWLSILRAAPPFNRPSGIAVSSSGEIYVSDGYGNARVHKFAPDGTLLLSWGEPGTGPGQFRTVHSLFLDKKERIWIAERDNNRLQIFDNQGKFLEQWTGLDRPTGVFVDDEETVYVCELTQRISIFDAKGKLLARWDSRGEELENALFLAPHAIVVDSMGDLYVGEVPGTTVGMDRGSRTVQKFARKI